MKVKKSILLNKAGKDKAQRGFSCFSVVFVPSLSLMCMSLWAMSALPPGWAQNPMLVNRTAQNRAELEKRHE